MGSSNGWGRDSLLGVVMPVYDYTNSTKPEIIGKNLKVPNLETDGDVDGVDVSAHDVATTGVHGVGESTIASAADIATHAEDNDAHHAVFTTTEHTSIGDNAPHHAKYTDEEAVTAMGEKADDNPLNHDKYTLEAHASNHTDGTDDIQDATSEQKGLATATQITKLDGIEAEAKDDQTGAEIVALLEALSAGSRLSQTKLDDICGSTFPASPLDGQVFTHEVTGRKILYVYDEDNTTWKPIISIGTMTLYVDKTDGTDDLIHGTGVDANAFATVQYAVDCIPGLVGGNVTININAEDYAETVTIQGKAFTGNYSITLQGTLTESSSGTQSANGVQGTGATQGSFTDTGNLAGVANLLCYLDADGDYRIIDSTNGNTTTIVSTFTSQPLSGENYVIYDWGTSINKILVKAGQVGIYLYDLKLTTSTALDIELNAMVYVYRCHIAERVQSIGGWCALDICYVTSSNSHTARIWRQSYLQTLRTKHYSAGNWLNGILAESDSVIVVSFGVVIDSALASNNSGLRCVEATTAQMACTAAYGYARVRNFAHGLYAAFGGQIQYTSNNQYSGCTTDENPVAASYGYID